MNKTRLRVWQIDRGHDRQPHRLIIWNMRDFSPDAPPVYTFRFDKGEIQKARTALDAYMTKEAGNG